VRRLFAQARLIIALFLCVWQERTAVESTMKRGRSEYRRQPPKYNAAAPELVRQKAIYRIAAAVTAGSR